MNKLKDMWGPLLFTATLILVLTFAWGIVQGREQGQAKVQAEAVQLELGTYVLSEDMSKPVFAWKTQEQILQDWAREQ